MIGRLLCLALVTILLAAPAEGAPRAELWPRWQAHEAESTRTVDHRPWDAFLSAYLRPAVDGGIARVAYGAVSAADRDALRSYIAALERAPVSGLNRDQQRALWINLYNAVTVRTILDHYPVDSIRDIDISPGLFSNGPWGRKLVTMEGVALSLDDIEHRILRPIWKDPRLHYVLNCAAVGCPQLADRAFTAANTEAMMDRAARQFVNHPRGLRLDGDRLVASSLYDWYGGDFGADDAAILDHMRLYADARTRALMQGRRQIDDFTYDWALNESR